MTTITKLSAELISQIAAGEIVERPASVVKELLDNALDAEATTLKIFIEEAGLKKISLLDNGIGMNADDLKISILPHTTSKISSIQDLHNVSTFGFRGEALTNVCFLS